MPEINTKYQNPNNFTVNPNYEEGEFERREVPEPGTQEWTDAAKSMYKDVRAARGLQAYLQSKIFDYVNSNYSKEDIKSSLKGLNERFLGDPALVGDDYLDKKFIDGFADYIEFLRNGIDITPTDEDYERMEEEKMNPLLESIHEDRMNRKISTPNEANFDYNSDLQRMNVESKREPMSKRAGRINNRANRISQKGQNMQERMDNNNSIKDFRSNTVNRKMDRANRKLGRVDKLMGYQEGGNVGISQRADKKIDGNSVSINKDQLDKLSSKIKNLAGGFVGRYQEGAQISTQEQQIVGLVQAAMQGNKEAEQTIQQIMQAAQAGDEQAIQIAQYIQAIVQQMQGAAKHMNGGKFGYVHYLRTGRSIGEKVRYVRNGGKINKVNVVGKTVEIPRTCKRKRQYTKYW